MGNNGGVVVVVVVVVVAGGGGGVCVQTEKGMHLASGRQHLLIAAVD